MADKNKPSWKVTGLTITKKDNLFTAKWTVPSAATNSKKDNCFTGVQVQWTLKFGNGETESSTKTISGGSTTTASALYRDIKSNRTRDSLYPNRVNGTAGRKIASVSVRVRGYHGSTKHVGDWCTAATYTFNVPRKPAVTMSYSGGNVTMNVKTDAGTDSCERQDTLISVYIRKQDGSHQMLLTDFVTKSTDYTRVFDISKYTTSLQSGKYVTVTALATARGIRGDSAPTNVDKTVAMPVAATIGPIVIDKKGAGGKANVEVTPGKFTEHVYLQRRHEPDSSWTDVPGGDDDGSEKCHLYDSWGNIWPVGQVKGERVYYRVKSTRDGFEVYSAQKSAECLYVAKPKDDCQAVLQLRCPNPGLLTAGIQVSWADNTSNEGTELSWSPLKNGWKSTDGAKTQEFANASKQGSNVTYTITDLAQDTDYYVRARRYRTVDNQKLYSGYSETITVHTDSAKQCSVAITGTEPLESGVKAYVTVKWAGEQDGEATTGTEISWSTQAGAWTTSTTKPSTQEVKSEGKNGTVKYVITGLTSGQTYYVRARRYLEASDGSKTYSYYSNRESFKTASAEGDPCAIISMSPDADGKGCKVVVGHNVDSDTGTTIEWSDDQHAWNSSSQPQSMQATWKDDSKSQSDTWDRTQTAYIRGLEPGKTYYVTATRYKVAGSTTTTGQVSKMQQFNTNAATALDDACGIVSARADKGDGTARITVGWTENSVNDHTELSWSTDAFAWNSNEGPDTLLADWQTAYSSSSNWGATQDIFLRGLEPGETYYFKARRHDEESNTYTPYSSMVALTLPKPVDEVKYYMRCSVLEVNPGDDGTTAEVVVGWDGERTGCEVSWSPDYNAWESSVQPESKEFDWKDEDPRSTVEGEQTSTFYINGLEEGVTYYVRARSYYEPPDGDRVWSDLSQHSFVTPYSAPSSVALYPPDPVARGESIELYWTVESELEQREFHVHEADKPGSSLVDGEGSLCHASIPASRYGDASALTLYVDAGCGGGLTSSNEVVASIAQRPSLGVACGQAVTRQPASFEATTDDPTSSLLATCRSMGITVEAAGGQRDQLAGDPVWTQKVEPAWVATTWGDTLYRASLEKAVEDAQQAVSDAQAALRYVQSEDTSVDPDKQYYELSGGAYVPVEPSGGEDPSALGWYELGEPEASALTNAVNALADAQAELEAHPSGGECYAATVTLPMNVSFVGGGTYEFAAKAVEPVAGLASAEATCSSIVEWAHRAPAPGEVTVDVDPDELTATIALPAPEGWEDGDVYDLYRKTPSGHDLIARSLAFGSVVVDRFAPYGKGADLSYRACCRTADGDEEYDDFPYELDGPLRVDWPGGSVELPYNVELSESYEKAFEARGHADGSYAGYYDRAVSMTGSYSTDAVKADLEQLALVREVAEHPGSCFVRTRQGMAFQCDCEVRDLSSSYSSGAAAIQLSVTRVRLSSLYMPEPDDISGGE